MRGHLPSFLRGTIASNALFYSFLSITALFGVFGTLARKAGLLGTYAYFLSYSIGVQIVIDVAYVWAFFSQSRASLVDRCIDGSTDQEVKNICDKSFDTGKWTFLVSVVIGLTIQLWAAYIVTSYAKKLQDEQAWRSGPGVAPPPDAAGSKYAHVHGDDHIPLTGPSYAYSDASHSFGSAAPHHTTASV
jgi:hypothetical protein